MCDHLILGGSAYLCRECYQELTHYFESWDAKNMVVADVRKRIEEFLRSTPGTYLPLDSDTLREEFNRLTSSSPES